MIIMELFRDFRHFTLRQKIIFLSANFLALYAIVGFFLLPPTLKYVLQKKLPQVLNREVSIDKIRVNPFVFSVEINDFVIREGKNRNKIFSFDQLYVNAQISSIFKRSLILKECRLDTPWAMITKNGERFTFSELLEPKESQPESEKPLTFLLDSCVLNNGSFFLNDIVAGEIYRKAKLSFSSFSVSGLGYHSEVSESEDPPMFLSFAETALGDGKFSFHDNAPEIPFKTSLAGIEIKVTDFSSKPGSNAQYSVLMKSGAGEMVKTDGRFGLLPLVAEGNFKLTKLFLPKYRPYTADILVPLVTGGTLDTSFDYRYTAAETDSVTMLTDLSFSLDGFKLQDNIVSKPFVKIGSLVIEKTSVDLIEQQVEAGVCTLQDADLQVIRFKDGSLNLFQMVKHADTIVPEKNDNSAAWVVSLKKSSISNFAVAIDDYQLETPAFLNVNIMQLDTDDISTVKGSTGKVSLELLINEEGRLSIDGSVSIDPPVADLKLNMNGFSLSSLQPYVTEVADLLITDGEVEMNGSLKVAFEDEKPVIRFTGYSSINNLKTLDGRFGDTLVNWTTLGINTIDLDTGTASYSVGEIVLQDLFAGLIVAEDGTINLQALIKKEEGEEEQPVSAKEDIQERGPVISIATLRLQNSRFDILDRSVSPSYSASVHDLSGSVTGLSSAENSRGTASFSGKLNQDAALVISGSVNPLLDNLYADVTIDLSNVEMSPLSPYSGKFIGKKIDKGKLGLDLHYLVEGRELKAENNVFLDQFTLGSSVDSPDAVSLPVGLAIALLKNRKGEITINLPVSGNLDDPEFSIGSIVFKALFNLIAKAATSPFALLGALIPEGEDLQQVDFRSGVSTLDSVAEKKLETLAKALYERPGLKVDIIGFFDPLSDTLALRQEQLTKQLKLAKLKDISKGQKKVQDIASVSLADDYDTYLVKAFAAVQKSLPLDKRVKNRKISPEKMKQLLFDTMTPGSDELRLLAISRAEQVKGFLIQHGPVEPERLFMIDPETVTEIDKTTVDNNAVEVKEETKLVRMVIK